MKYSIFCILIASGSFYVGWIFGAIVTARSIANAIVNGELSLDQHVEAIADQIESGIYRGDQ